METLYQLKLGKPFSLNDIDHLFYACSYVNSSQSFFIEKEKFGNLFNKGFITEYRNVSSL